mgnify:CR=1 FL=1
MPKRIWWDIRQYFFYFRNTKQILFEGSEKLKRLSGESKREPISVEPLSGQPVLFKSLFVRFEIAIGVVSEDGEADLRHVDSDLMGSTRQEIYLNEAVFILNASKHFESGLSEFGIDRI